MSIHPKRNIGTYSILLQMFIWESLECFSELYGGMSCTFGTNCWITVTSIAFIMLVSSSLLDEIINKFIIYVWRYKNEWCNMNCDKMGKFQITFRQNTRSASTFQKQHCTQTFIIVRKMSRLYFSPLKYVTLDIDVESSRCHIC